MSQPDPFEHHPEHPKSAPPIPHPERSPLAVHRDPSQSVEVSQMPTSATTGKAAVAWVRIADLPAQTGQVVMRRGVDLFTELVRRGRRAPVRLAVKGVRRAAGSVVVHSQRREAPSSAPSGEVLGQ